ncbi:hypothetical protein ACTI_67660 [Actinoplanes sp. OR16]|nr:hypothetical protein ACTI_67660 [Actinoplanes sp. OR16]
MRSVRVLHRATPSRVYQPLSGRPGTANVEDTVTHTGTRLYGPVQTQARDRLHLCRPGERPHPPPGHCDDRPATRPDVHIVTSTNIRPSGKKKRISSSPRPRRTGGNSS